MTLNDEIKTGLDKGTIVLGENAVIRRIRQSKISKVVLASNCSLKVKEEVVFLCDTSSIACENINLTNIDLGAMCKRSHSVSVLGFTK